MSDRSCKAALQVQLNSIQNRAVAVTLLVHAFLLDRGVAGPKSGNPAAFSSTGFG